MTERERFAHAVNALSQDAMHLVTDLITAPPADRPYTALKERLLSAHLSPALTGPEGSQSAQQCCLRLQAAVKLLGRLAGVLPNR